jgi:manganese/iron transport system permease protein
MDPFADWVIEPWRLEFMRRAFTMAAVAGVVCGVLGTYVVLRGVSFIGDAIAHAVFPGVVAAHLLGGSLVVGGSVFGLATSLGIGLVAQNRRLREDAVIGVFFTFAFGLGITLASIEHDAGGLQSFLFGQILAISRADVAAAAGLGALLLTAGLVIRRELAAVAFDREMAQASGLPVVRLDLALYGLVTVAIVIAVQAIGNILALALLVTPGATARLVTTRLGSMMATAGAMGAASGIVGLYLSYYLDLAASGLIVLVLTAGFTLAWVSGRR